jgi:hypothetical protein
MTFRGFVFSLEAAFSLAMVFVALSYLQAFEPQNEEAGGFLACSDAAKALSEARAFSSQETLQRAVDDAGALLGTCVDAQSEGLAATSCENGAQGAQKTAFSIPAWSGGKLLHARVWCYHPK